jgi:hypothetical protein
MCQTCEVFNKLDLLPRQIVHFGFVFSCLTLVWNFIKLPPYSFTLNSTAEIHHQVLERLWYWASAYFRYWKAGYSHFWLKSFQRFLVLTHFLEWA